MKKTKIAAIVLAGAMGITALTGCGSKAEDKQEQSTQEQETQEPDKQEQETQEQSTQEPDTQEQNTQEPQREAAEEEETEELNDLEKEAEFPDLASFTAETLDGKEFTQADFAQTDLTAINIWATSCGPCIEEMPDLAAFAKTLPENVKLITYCTDGKGQEDLVKEILEMSGFEGTTLIGGDGDLTELDKSVQYTPTTVFVDSSGKMVGSAVIGAEDNPAEKYTNRINHALKQLGKQVIS